MKVIGFTKKFYTLWEVSEPYREYTSAHSFYEKVDYVFIQNLSTSLDKAKSKLSGEFEVDLSLKGSSSFSKTTSALQSDLPLDVFAFGKYKGSKINECSDMDYLAWYHSQSQSEDAARVLSSAGYKLMPYGTFISPKEAAEIEVRKQIQEQSGLHFDNGQKVELRIKLVDSFSFSGSYGQTWVETYLTACGKIVKYMGGKPADISKDSFTKVSATVKHANYRGEDETRLTRIKIN